MTWTMIVVVFSLALNEEVEDGFFGW